jgi:hypothetical protein
MDNVKNFDSEINVPSSQTYSSHYPARFVAET